ncbi:MAG TPA: macro domain-containing protein [Gemmatimonadales bacterium]|nr:macro domain-containing protein [Gemmatimonadales bacterium]
MIRVVVDDIAFVQADAVVRPATETLEPTSSALRHLEQVAGAGLQERIRVQQPLGVGAAVVTAAGDLPTEFVIHAVITGRRDPVSRQSVQRALTSALQRAVDWELARLTVPPLGTGAGNLSVEDAAEVMCEVLTRHMATTSFPTDVQIVVETEVEKLVFEGYLRRAEP